MMAKRRGRSSKPGKRTKSGRLARDGYAQPLYDCGNERVQALSARYGTHYSTALGRAYAAGLLGEPQEALNRYNKMRSKVVLPSLRNVLDCANAEAMVVQRGHRSDMAPALSAPPCMAAAEEGGKRE